MDYYFYSANTRDNDIDSFSQVNCVLQLFDLRLVKHMFSVLFKFNEVVVVFELAFPVKLLIGCQQVHILEVGFFLLFLLLLLFPNCKLYSSITSSFLPPFFADSLSLIYSLTVKTRGLKVPSKLSPRKLIWYWKMPGLVSSSRRHSSGGLQTSRSGHLMRISLIGWFIFSSWARNI